MARRLPNFIDAIVQVGQTSSESATSFIKWGAGISTVASLLQRKVYTVRDGITIYPNHYIGLLARPGIARKGQPLEWSREILQAVDRVVIVPESITPRAFTSFLAGGEAQTLIKTNPEGQEDDWQQAVSLIMPEMRLGSADYQGGYAVLLCRVYDCPDQYDYYTQHSGTDHLKKVCVNLLTSCPPDTLPDIMPKRTFTAGLASRGIWVFAPAKSQTLSDWGEVSLRDEAIWEDILHDARHIRDLVGKMSPTRGARLLYKASYEKVERQLLDRTHPLSSTHFDPYLSRWATHLVKLSMVLCAAERDDMTIQEAHIARAKEELETVEKHMHHCLDGYRVSPLIDGIERAKQLIGLNGGASVADITEALHGQYTMADINQVIETIENMALVTKYSGGSRGDHYTFKKKGAN